MQRRRPAPHSQDLARRFLQLDTDIRLAAAGTLLPMLPDDRPESPVQQYPWDALLQHPKPKPANGPIKIQRIETAAKTKVRSVSDPGDAHRLIARFVRTNEEKTRSMTVSATDPPMSPQPPSPGIASSMGAGPSGSGQQQQQQRVFPFPSMRRQTTLENFIELESSANETGREDPLALKMGQILARRAAAATRAVSRRRSRSGSVSSGSRSRVRGGGARPSSGLSVGFGPEDVGMGASVAEGSGASAGGRVARPRPPPIDVSGSTGVALGQGQLNRDSVVVDDRSPNDGNFWARTGTMNMNAGTSTIPENAATTSNAETREEESRGPTLSYSVSRDELRSFVFPAAAPPPEPVRQYAHVRVQPDMRGVPGSPTQFVVSGTPTSFAMPGSPASFIMTAPGSPMSWMMPATPTRLVVPSTPTSFVVVPSPTSYVMQASPTSGVYLSPVESVGGMVPGAYEISPTGVFQPSPPRQQNVSGRQYPISPARQHPISPTRQHPISPSRQHPISPTRQHPVTPTRRHQVSPSTSTGYHPSPTHHHSDAHINLLRGLSPLPSHGLPLPAPLRPHSFNLLTTSGMGHGTAAPNRFSVSGRIESPVVARGASPGISVGSPLGARVANPVGRTSSPAGRAVTPVGRLGSPGLGRVGSPLARVASISPPQPSSPTPPPSQAAPSEAPAPSVISSSPLRFAIRPPPPPPASSALPAEPSSPSPLPTRAVSPSLPIASPSPIREAFPTRSLNPTPIPIRTLSPVPPRLRHHTNASHPSDGSGSDEVVFRGSSSSASSTPSRRARRRSRARVTGRSNGEGLVRRTMSEGMRSNQSREARRTAQALLRRRQTGAAVGDGGEVSSDGRELVVFMPSRGPPPPVPRVPASTPPASEVPIVRVEQPAGPAPPPLLRRESIPLPEQTPYPGASNLGPPPAVSRDVPIQSGTEPIQNPADAPLVELAQNPTANRSMSTIGSRTITDRTIMIEVVRPIIEMPAPQRPLSRLPWSPPSRVRSREMASREGSFHTAPDSFVEEWNHDTEAEFPSSVPGSFPDQSYMEDADRARYLDEARYVNTPAHMDLSDLGEGGSSMHSVFTSAEGEAQDVLERATISSAMRAHVATPAILSRRPSGELMPMPGGFSGAPSPPRSPPPARRGRPTEGLLAGVFQPGFLVPPSLAPSPLASSGSGSSHTPNSVGAPHAHTASIPMRHDQEYSPPRSGLPRSVTPRTEASGQQPEDNSFHSTHTADPTLRLPLDDWLEFAMSSMAAMGIPLTRSTLEDLHESEDDSVAVAEVLSISSNRRFDDRDDDDHEMLDAISQASEDSEDSSSRILSDVGSTPSPSRSASGRSVFTNQEQGVEMTTFSSAPDDPSAARPTIHTDLPYSPGLHLQNLSAISGVGEESESERAVEHMQNLAGVVREMNARTPIPSAASSQAPRLPSVSDSAPMYTPPTSLPLPGGPIPDVGAAPMPGMHQNAIPTRALSPGSVSITFNETGPTLSPAPSLVVFPGDRDRFADSLLVAEYQHQQQQNPHRRSFQYLRDDDFRALEQGEDVVLYGVGGRWEQVDSRARTLSHVTTESAVPVDYEGGFDLDNEDPQSRKKYMQFVLSFANALRTPSANRPQRWVEVALRTLRGQAHGARPRYPSFLFDAIDRAEAGLEPLPPPPAVSSHLSSTFITSSSSASSSSLGSALPEDDQIVEDFVRRSLPPQAATPPPPPPPPQPATPLRVEVEVTSPIAWPVLASPVVPRPRLPPTTSITSSASSGSVYSSIIPPLPRPRSRSIEPHWLRVYMTRRWPVPDTYVSRRTFSSPSALGPPMPYHWRPICHISPERLWEITNLAVRMDMPPPPPPPAALSAVSASPTDPIRPHFTTPVTTHDRMTPYSSHSGSSHSPRSLAPPPPPVTSLYNSAGQMMSHPNLPIHASPSQPALPLESTMSRTSIPLVQRAMDPSFSPRSSVDATRPAPTVVASRAMTPAAVSRKRTMKDIVGKLVGRERARTRSNTRSRTPPQLISKTRFGLAGRVVDVARRVLRHRRTRVSSTRSQRTIRNGP